MPTYYVDFTNGNDSHDGLGEGVSSNITAETGTDATHVYVTKDTLAKTNDDDYNGDFLYNVTRSTGVIISDYDYDNGSGMSVLTTASVTSQTSGDTFYILRSWKTTSKAAITLAAGDIAYVRGGMTDSPSADINFINDGTVENYITIEGCYTASPDPWHDGTTTRPIIDFADGAFQIAIMNDNYWKLKSLDVMRSADTEGAIAAGINQGMPIIEDCRIYDNNGGSNGIGLKLQGSANVKDCILYDNKTNNISIYIGAVYIENCYIYGGENGTQNGLVIKTASAMVKNTKFGKDISNNTSQHSGSDVYVNLGGSPPSIMYGRNVVLASTTPVHADYYAVAGDKALVSIEDDTQTHCAFKQWQFSGIAQKSTTYKRDGDGGTAWSILGEANSNCNANFPLYLIGDWMRGIPIYLDGTEQTITMYALCHDGASTTYTSADKFTIEVEHYESAGVWAIDTSTQDFAAEDTWTAFSVTLTPGAAGPAYVRVKLLEYNGNHDLYVDPTPVIS